jgi:hypothetical protein
MSPEELDQNKAEEFAERMLGVGEERGYDGGKKIKGRKRHLLVDTEGLVPSPNNPSARRGPHAR